MGRERWKKDGAENLRNSESLVLPREGRGTPGDTGANGGASQSWRAAGSPSWPWSSAWDDGTLCAFSREILVFFFFFNALCLSLQSSSFSSFLSVQTSKCFAVSVFFICAVSSEDVAGRRASRRQCACSSSHYSSLSLSALLRIGLSLSLSFSLWSTR